MLPRRVQEDLTESGDLSAERVSLLKQRARLGFLKDTHSLKHQQHRCIFKQRPPGDVKELDELSGVRARTPSAILFETERPAARSCSAVAVQFPFFEHGSQSVKRDAKVCGELQISRSSIANVGCVVPHLSYASVALTSDPCLFALTPCCIANRRASVIRLAGLPIIPGDVFKGAGHHLLAADVILQNVNQGRARASTLPDSKKLTTESSK